MAVVLLKTVSTSLISLVVSITTIVSVAIVLNLYLPLISEFLTSGLPLFYVSLKSWLTPPYLYIVINFIILTIVASSRFQQKIDQHMESFVPEAPVKIQQDFVVPMVCDDKSILVNSPVELPQEVGGVVGYGDEFVVIKNPVELRQEVGNNVIGDEFSMKNRMMSVELELVPEVFEMDKKIEVSVAAEKDEAEIVTSRDIDMPSLTESMEIPVNFSSFSKEKPPVSARFGHRKLAKTSPEAGKSLRVTKPKSQDTLKSTWKMITEGRSIPLARHLKKSDTWETHAHLQDSVQNEHVTKSDTFNCRTNVSSTTLVRPQGSGKLRLQGSGKLRKEASLTQDDLNKRVEAFINKFNEEMRLQRMESLNRYKQMINR